MLKFILPKRPAPSGIKGVYAAIYRYYAMRLKLLTPVAYQGKFVTLRFVPEPHLLASFRKSSPAYHVNYTEGYEGNDPGFEPKHFWRKSLVPRDYAVYRVKARLGLRECLEHAVTEQTRECSDSDPRVKRVRSGVYCFTVDQMARPDERLVVQREMAEAVAVVWGMTPALLQWVAKANARIKPSDLSKAMLQVPGMNSKLAVRAKLVELGIGEGAGLSQGVKGRPNDKAKRGVKSPRSDQGETPKSGEDGDCSLHPRMEAIGIRSPTTKKKVPKRLKGDTPAQETSKGSKLLKFDLSDLKLLY